MSGQHVLGIDLGATNLRAAVGDGATVLARTRRPTPQGPGGTVTEAVLSAVREACEAAGLDPGRIAAAGIGSIGPLDREAGAVVDPPNVPAGRIELVDPLASLLSTERVRLYNDAVAGVVGERALAGAPENAVYLTLSTGIGAGACVDGTVLSGRGGNAAEMGHVAVDPGGRRCGCGGRGHWEAYCSGSAIPGFAAELAAETGLRTELPLGDGDAAVDAADVFARAGDDPLADRVLEAVGRLNALGVAAVTHAFAPAAVRVGGAVALENVDRVLGPVRERLPAHLAVEAPRVAPAGLGADAVLLGALASARRLAGGSPAGQ